MAFNINSVDSNAQKQGVWQSYAGSEFLVASSSKTSYQKRLNQLRKPFSKAIDRGTVNPEDITGIYCKALSEQILLDWRGVEGVDGKGNVVEVPYSVESAFNVLKENEEFREFVSESSGDQALFERNFKDNIVK